MFARYSEKGIWDNFNFWKKMSVSCWYQKEKKNRTVRGWMIFLALPLFRYYREEYSGHWVLQSPLTNARIITLGYSTVQLIITPYDSGAARSTKTVQQQDRVAFAGAFYSLWWFVFQSMPEPAVALLSNHFLKYWGPAVNWEWFKMGIYSLCNVQNH